MTDPKPAAFEVGLAVGLFIGMVAGVVIAVFGAGVLVVAAVLSFLS